MSSSFCPFKETGFGLRNPAGKSAVQPIIGRSFYKVKSQQYFCNQIAKCVTFAFSGAFQIDYPSVLARLTIFGKVFMVGRLTSKNT